jgi:hypothetical protein
MTESLRQNLICAVLVLVSIGIVLLLSPKTVYEPRGIMSTIGTASAPIPVSDVTAYAEFPPGATEKGYFSIELLDRENPVEAQRQLVNYARTLAAQIGAQGVVVEQLARGGDLWFLMGKAIT